MFYQKATTYFQSIYLSFIFDSLVLISGTAVPVSALKVRIIPEFVGLWKLVVYNGGIIQKDSLQCVIRESNMLDEG